jgi:hypothetical protein
MRLDGFFCCVFLGNPFWAFVTSLFTLTIFLAERSPMQEWMMVAPTLAAIFCLFGTWSVTLSFGALVAWMVNQAAEVEVVLPAGLQSLLRLHCFEDLTSGYGVACLLAHDAKILLLL